jgi:RimJ/RimL family protein N-acetyltransferase
LRLDSVHRAFVDLLTERLRLRNWRDDDLDAFVEMSQDREVMECFPSLFTCEQAESALVRNAKFIAEKGYGFWALEVLGGAPFVGFCGIKDVLFEAPFTPAVEVGWRLARAHWGKGYATEAARASLEFGFGTLALDEIVAFLLPANRRSAAVCERLGMRRDPSGDFDHPLIPTGTISVGGHPQQRHILYRLSRT